jgi:hypothetical protein
VPASTALCSKNELNEVSATPARPCSASLSLLRLQARARRAWRARSAARRFTGASRVSASRARVAACAALRCPCVACVPAQAFLAWAFAGITVHGTVILFRLTLLRLVGRGDPSVDFPFAGTSVHRTLVFIRRNHGHLRALATISGEKFGLAIRCVLFPPPRVVAPGRSRACRAAAVRLGTPLLSAPVRILVSCCCGCFLLHCSTPCEL